MDDRARKYLSSRDENILLIYGIRKSGKTSYIKNSLKGRKEKILYYEMKNTNGKENFQLLKERLRFLIGIDCTSEDFESLFTAITSLDERIIVILENIELLSKFTSTSTLSWLKKLAGKHRVILTTRDIAFAEEAEKDEAFIAIEKIVPKYYESFDPLRSLPSSKQLTFFLVFGSSEFAISKIDPEESLKRNVRNLLLTSESAISEYIDHELFEDLGKKSYAFLILSLLKDRRMKYGELVSLTGQKYNGLLDKQLNILSELGLIRKSYPINKKVDRKKVLYEISDNLLRFYFRFIYPNRDLVEMIGSKAYYEKYIEKELDDYFRTSLRTVLTEYLEKASLDGKLGSITLIGRYYIDDEREEEMALITEEEKRIYSIFYDKRVDDEMFSKERKRIKDLTGGEAEVGLFSTNGFTFPSDGETCISLKDVFSLKA